MEEKTSSYKIKCNVCGLKEEKNQMYYYCPVDHHNYHADCIPEETDP